jgi:putative hemolysin
LEPKIDDPFPEGIVVLLSELITSPYILYSIYGGILIFLLFLSSMISGSEVAFFSLSSNQISNFKDSGDVKVKRVYELVRHPKKLLATILILNNLVNVAIITLSTYFTWQIVGARTTEGLVIVILTFIVTFMIIFFGEVVPKVYANQNNVKFTKTTATFISISQTLVNPLAKVLMSLSNVIEKRIQKKGYVISMEDLNQALEITTRQEATVEEKDILKSIVNFGTISVKQIMRSRMDITAFDTETGYQELLDNINKIGYSRIPIYRETIDKIEGILYIKDLLPYIDQDENFKWQTLLRPGYYVPETKKIDDLLRDFQEKRVHMAIVVDEYGGTAGLITMEDIIEEIVGEINDEFDEDEIAFNKLDENTYVFEGKTSLNDFCKIVGEDPALFEGVKGESESLGGLILELNNKLPRTGDKIMFNRFVFTIVAVDNRRIKRVRVFIQAATVKNSDSV